MYQDARTLIDFEKATTAAKSLIGPGRSFDRGGSSMTYDDWIAVERLPGKRITRRLDLEHFPAAKYLDDTGTVIAVMESSVFTTPTRKYRFGRKGLETDEDHVLVISRPRRSLGNPLRVWRIRMPDGRRLRFRLTERHPRFAVGEILDEDGCLLTLRWTNDTGPCRDEGEAVIAPREPPVDPVLLAVYGFEIFDRFTPYRATLREPGPPAGAV